MGRKPSGPVVRTRRDWANDDAHRREFPGHVTNCPNCWRPFDKKVDPSTGAHHERRPATYCSDTCQRQAKQKRAKSDPTFESKYEPGTLRNVWQAIQSVRLQLTRNGGWGQLAPKEWDLIRNEAPTIAALLRYYSNVRTSQRNAQSFIDRHGQDRADQLQRDVVASITRWLASNSPEGSITQ